MVHVYDKHIAVTPYNTELVLNGIRAVKLNEFDPASLRRLSWPQEKGIRKAGGGDGGEIVSEPIRVSWEGNQLVFPISESCQSLAERGSDHSIINYHALFLAQLDGEVAYRPSEQNIDFYYILVENVDHQFQAIRFASDQTAIVEPYVKHSMPIPSRFDFQYESFHRSVNAVEKFLPNNEHPPIFNIMKVDRSTLVAAGRIPHKNLADHHEHHSISKSFSKKLLPLEEASDEIFADYGVLIYDPHHNETPTEAPWPGVTTQDGFAGVLEQDFQMSWEAGEEGTQELVFKGLSGSFAGDSGKPGVEYSQELGVYKANLILTRPDSSFFLKTASSEAAFAMAFALSKEGKGEPDENSLRVFTFHSGKALRLNPFVWHTVPIPLANQESILLTEVVAATNANLTVDVNAETGHPIQFTQAI